MTSATATIQDLDRHAASVRAGFTAMTPPPPRHRGFSTAAAPEDEPPQTEEAAPEPVESTDQRVLREAGIVGKMDLRWHGLANIENLTGDLLAKKEKLRLVELQAALDRLAAEIAAAAQTPLNPHKIASAAPIGEMPSAEAIAAGLAGDDGRQFRKRTAKAAAMRFFDTECKPVVIAIYSKAAALLEAAILERRKAEESAFEKFAQLYNDDDSATGYRPSGGLIRMMSRRRQLIDNEIPSVNPPNLRAALHGIVAF